MKFDLTNKKIKFTLFVTLLFIFVFPELNNLHYDPLPQFWAEITVAYGVIGLFILTIFSFKKVFIKKKYND